MRTKRQQNNNPSRVHDSVNHPRLRSPSLSHGPDLGAQYAATFRPEPLLKKSFISLSVLSSRIPHYQVEMNHRDRKVIQDSPGRKSYGNSAAIKNERGKTMKILRIPLVIVLVVVAGRGFNAKAQGVTNQISGIQVAGTNVVISAQSVGGDTYQLQSRNSMTTGNWSNVAGVVLSNSPGGLIILTNFGGASAPQEFYRLDITPTPTCPVLTGQRDNDMYNAAVADGTANGGVPAVMRTQDGGGGLFAETARGPCSDAVCAYYAGWSVFTQIVGSNSCSSTTFTNGEHVIQFGDELDCFDGPFSYNSD